MLVTDGKLTLTPTGVNTKLNWVTITGNALSAPSIAVTVNGTPIDDEYNGGAATVAASALVATDATLESLTYSIDGAATTDYDEPFVLDAEGLYDVVFTATDSEGRTTTREVTLEVLDIGGTLKLTNAQVTRQADGSPIPGLYDDVLVFHRVNSLGSAAQHQNLRVQRRGSGDARQHRRQGSADHVAGGRRRAGLAVRDRQPAGAAAVHRARPVRAADGALHRNRRLEGRAHRHDHGRVERPDAGHAR